MRISRWQTGIFVGLADYSRVAALAYRDVEGYGAQDIVLEAEPWCGNRSCAEALMVFTNHGEELTGSGLAIRSFLRGGSRVPIMAGTFTLFMRAPNFRRESRWSGTISEGCIRTW